jgi:RHS repeat-associated protein
LSETEILHYDGPGDSPSWTKRGSSVTRYVTGVGGELAAIRENESAPIYQLTDLSGDVVASASSSPAETKLLATYRFDEFGNPVSDSAGRFGWLGGKLRRTELPSGVIQMGARSYVPAMRRFLTPDPVPGGSASAYDYADADPVNGLDLTGEANRGRRRQRDGERVARVLVRAREHIGRISARTRNRQVATSRIKTVVHAAFAQLKGPFTRQPAWGPTCHAGYNGYLSSHSAVGVGQRYETAVQKCGRHVARVGIAKGRREIKQENEEAKQDFEEAEEYGEKAEEILG